MTSRNSPSFLSPPPLYTNDADVRKKGTEYVTYLQALVWAKQAKTVREASMVREGDWQRAVRLVLGF